MTKKIESAEIEIQVTVFERSNI